MILLYAGSGSHEVQLLESSVPEAAWRVDRRQAVRLLEQRWEHEAARLLTEIPFELRDGTNGFNDEFSFLYYRAPLSRYVSMADSIEEPATKHHYRQIAKALEETGHPIRFVALELDRNEEAALPEAVDTPSLAIRSDAVERALRDAEHLIDGRGASSGVDRFPRIPQGCRRFCDDHGACELRSYSVIQGSAGAPSRLQRGWDSPRRYRQNR